jgi:hypothetical protein
MKRATILLVSASFVLWACGSDGGGGDDGVQADLADLLIAQDIVGAEDPSQRWASSHGWTACSSCCLQPIHCR